MASPMDMLGMMGKFRELQEKMAGMQEAVERLEVEGASGGGLVTVRLNGKGVMRGLSIDPSLIEPGEAEILEDLIVAAHNDARARAEAAAQEKTRELTAGLPLPPGFNLPI